MFIARSAAAALLLLLCGAKTAWAQAALAQQEVSDQKASTEADGIPKLSIANTLPDKGDPYGIRKALAQRGITFDALYTGEVMSAVRGGLRRGSAYGGQLEMSLTAKLDQYGLPGLSFFSNGFQLHQTKGLSRNFVGNLNAISDIEALPATRLSELWLQQSLFGGKISIRLGQLAADTEFTGATFSLPFISSDWPALLRNNLPGNGPAFPLATPGIRLKLDPDRQNSLLLALFNGDPAGPDLDPEIRNRTGTNFRTRDPGLLMAEYQHRYNQQDEDKGLAGALKFGAWYHLGRFDHQRVDDTRLSLASDSSSGMAARLRGNGGVYGIVDQQLYRPDGGKPDDGIGIFTRLFLAPSDRNPIAFFVDGGVVASGLIPERPNDKIGLSALYSHLGKQAGALDRDYAVPAGLYRPVAHSELSLEGTYVAQIRTGWTLQPTVTRVIRPDGGRVQVDTVSGSIRPRLKDATVLGMRTTILY